MLREVNRFILVAPIEVANSSKFLEKKQEEFEVASIISFVSFSDIFQDSKSLDYLIYQIDYAIKRYYTTNIAIVADSRISADLLKNFATMLESAIKGSLVIKIWRF